MSKKGIVWALVAAVIGAIYLMMATLGPLKDSNFGLGLTAGLSSQKIAGGYNMANVVLFGVFVIVIIVLAVLWSNNQKKKL